MTITIIITIMITMLFYSSSKGRRKSGERQWMETRVMGSLPGDGDDDDDDDSTTYCTGPGPNRSIISPFSYLYMFRIW